MASNKPVKITNQWQVINLKILLAIGWLFLQVYYLPLIGYFSGLLLAIGWLFLQVYYLPLIGYFSGLLLAIDLLFFRFITCH
jgi:uncharacterized membrane protein